MSLPVLFKQEGFKNSRMAWILIHQLKAGFPSLLHCKISTYLKRKTCPKAQRRPPQNQSVLARKSYLDFVSCVWKIIFGKRASKCPDYSIYEENDVAQEYT